MLSARCLSSYYDPAVPDRTITTSDGRDLRIHEAGDLDGYPVVYHHGTPSEGTLLRQWVEDASARGVRLIGYDRAGYGGSAPKPGRSVADIASDITSIADALGVDRFATWGISGGGPHALACAALLADRVSAAASLAAVAPYDADGLDWLAGMGRDNIEEFGAAVEGREALERWMAAHVPGLLAADPAGVAEAMASLLSPVDRAAFTGEIGAAMADSMQTALRNRADGWIDDDLAFVSPWGFDVAEIGVPLLLWQGDHDLFVPPSHGAWLAARIPGVDAHLSPEDGHLTLIANRVPEVHAWLLEHAIH